DSARRDRLRGTGRAWRGWQRSVGVAHRMGEVAIGFGVASRVTRRETTNGSRSSDDAPVAGYPFRTGLPFRPLTPTRATTPQEISMKACNRSLTLAAMVLAALAFASPALLRAQDAAADRSAALA